MAAPRKSQLKSKNLSQTSTSVIPRSQIHFDVRQQIVPRATQAIGEYQHEKDYTKNLNLIMQQNQQKQPAFQMQQQSVSQQHKVDDETVNLDTSGAMTPQRTIGADQSQSAKLGMTTKSQK